MTQQASRVNSPFQAAKLAWIGARSYQEDNCAFERRAAPGGPELIAVLADGMGGHAGGDVASSVAVAAAMAELGGNDAAPPRERLIKALAEANKAVGAAVKQKPELKGMGCTFIAVICSVDRVDWVSVGDSPMWAIEDRRLIRLNADHSLKVELAERVRKGEITAEEAARHPQRNALTSAVMGEKITLYDQSAAPLPQGRRLLLASDGIETLSVPELEATLRDAPNGADATCQALIGAVRDRAAPKQDNTTVIVIANGEAGVVSDTATSMHSPMMKFLWPAIAGVALILVLLAGFILFSGGDPKIVDEDGEETKTGLEASAAPPLPPRECILDNARQSGPGSLADACDCYRENWRDEAARKARIGQISPQLAEAYKACQAEIDAELAPPPTTPAQEGGAGTETGAEPADGATNPPSQPGSGEATENPEAPNDAPSGAETEEEAERGPLPQIGGDADNGGQEGRTPEETDAAAAPEKPPAGQADEDRDADPPKE